MPNRSLWDADVQPISELKSVTPETDFDVLIVGGGLLGCSIAQELSRTAPHVQCLVIERGEIPIGASTRNAGFACFGSVGEISADIDRMGAKAAKDLVERRVNGLHRMRASVIDAQVDFQLDGGHEIFLTDDPVIDRISEVNALLAPLFPAPPFQLRDDLIVTYGFSDRVRHLIRTPYEGMLHSGKLLNAIRPQHIVTGEVTNISRLPDATWKLTLASSRTIQTKCVILATNAWLPDLVPDLKIEPARGQILVTKPLTNPRLHGTFHMNAGYVYFRTVADRVLLGGGRNMAFDEERTRDMHTTVLLQHYLEDLLHTVILPHEPVQIDMRWAGIMAFTPNKQPIIQQVEDGLWVAMTCNGMGVALARNVASEAAAVVLQHGSST